MFLNNWYTCISAIITQISGVKCVTVDGTTATCPINTSSSSIYNTLRLNYLMKTIPLGTHLKNVGAVFGTGNSAAIDDYTLSGTLLTSAHISAVCSLAADYDNEGMTLTGTYTISNVSANEITISEIGLVTYNSSVYCLVEHTVLDTPVTIPAGGVGQVTYTIRFNYPTA